MSTQHSPSPVGNDAATNEEIEWLRGDIGAWAGSSPLGALAPIIRRVLNRVDAERNRAKEAEAAIAALRAAWDGLAQEIGPHGEGPVVALIEQRAALSARITALEEAVWVANHALQMILASAHGFSDLSDAQLAEIVNEAAVIVDKAIPLEGTS